MEVGLAGRSGETALSSTGLTPPSHVQLNLQHRPICSLPFFEVHGNCWKRFVLTSMITLWLFISSRGRCSGVMIIPASQSSGCRLCFVLRNTLLSLRGKRWAGFPLRHATDADADTSLFLYRRNGWVTFCHLMRVCVDFCCIFNYQLYPKQETGWDPENRKHLSQIDSGRNINSNMQLQCT